MLYRTYFEIQIQNFVMNQFITSTYSHGIHSPLLIVYLIKKFLVSLFGADYTTRLTLILLNQGRLAQLFFVSNLKNSHYEQFATEGSPNIRFVSSCG